MITRRELLKKGLKWVAIGGLLEPLLDVKSQTMLGNDLVALAVYPDRIDMLLQPYLLASLQTEKISVYRYGVKTLFTQYLNYRTSHYNGEMIYGSSIDIRTFVRIHTPYYKAILSPALDEEFKDALSAVYYRLKPGQRGKVYDMALVREKDMLIVVKSINKDGKWEAVHSLVKEIEGVLRYGMALIIRDNTIKEKPIEAYPSKGSLVIKPHESLPDVIVIDFV